MGVRVEATVTDGVLEWQYVNFGNVWRQSIPLQKLVPHPTITEDRGTQRQYLSATFVLPLVAFGVLYWFNFYFSFAALVAVGMFCVLAYRYAIWLLGPMEWAIFDTTLKGKTIYVFRGGKNSGFDEFVTALDHAISAAKQTDGKPSSTI